MTTNFQSSEDISDLSRDFIEKKLAKLDTYYDRIERADVYIKRADGSSDVIVQVKLAVPGPDLIADDQSESLEKSTSAVVDKLARQIRKFKEKLNTH